jgi:DNA-binding transcriptional LysR family regulator
MTVFAKVASTRSFSGAARELGISQATASKHVQTLEDWLGVRLLHRTTRRVALTDVGESFFVQCTRILEEMETARCSAKPEAPVRGSMRITAPVVFGSTRLGPLVVDFMHRHPDLSLNVELSDRSVDLIEEGYDLAIRTSPTTSDRLATDVARLCAMCGAVLSRTPWRAHHDHGAQYASLHYRQQLSRRELEFRWAGRANGGADLRQVAGQQRHAAMRCRACWRWYPALRAVPRRK